MRYCYVPLPRGTESPPLGPEVVLPTYIPRSFSNCQIDDARGKSRSFVSNAETDTDHYRPSNDPRQIF